MRKKSLGKYTLIIIAALAGSHAVEAHIQTDTTHIQTIGTAVPDTVTVKTAEETAVLQADGDRLMLDYRFSEALEKYHEAGSTDTTENLILGEKVLNATNAISLLDFVSSPTVVSKQRFSIEDFHLFYPLRDKSWRPVPNTLDPAATAGPVQATYFPENTERIYYSAEDEDNIRNIYFTELRDTIWSLPVMMDENITSAANEIYPMLSPDGNQMFFASDGLYGIGGYDIFTCNWNEETGSWDAPVNLGFPYSSPADDFLYINTDDGKYEIFASNRECGKDSVWIYVLEKENMPVRTAMTEKKVKELSRLRPTDDASMMDNNRAASDNLGEKGEIGEYAAKMAHVRVLRDTLSSYNNFIDEKRNRYATSEDLEERARLTKEILTMEARLPHLQDSLETATAEIQKIEMDFLFRGVIIDPSVIAEEADKEVVGAKTNYTFVRQHMGAPLDLKIEQPVPEFDYTFQILPEAQMAENQEIPSGIVYQIQFLNQNRDVTLSRLKGLSPVFLHHPTPSRYVYRVGVFRNYADVMANLNKVKRLGFRSAFTVAFHDGRQISVAEAKKLEATAVAENWQVTLIPDADMSNAEAGNIIRSLTENEFTAVNSSGKIIFIIDEFQSEEEAGKFKELAVAGGFAEAEVKKLEPSPQTVGKKD